MKKLIPILLLFNWQAMQAATFDSNVTINKSWSDGPSMDNMYGLPCAQPVHLKPGIVHSKPSIVQ